MTTSDPRSTDGHGEARESPRGVPHSPHHHGHPGGPDPDHRRRSWRRSPGPHPAVAPPQALRRAVDLLALVVGLGAGWYLAPLEYQAGRWLGLPTWQAWTITAVVEGLTAAALVAGLHAGHLLLPTALTLTWVSAGTGQLHAAAQHARELKQTIDRPTVAGALTVCTLMVICPALMHTLRTHVAHAHTTARAHERSQQDAAAAAEHAAQLAQAATDQQQHEREHERAAQERREQRYHERALAEIAARTEADRATAERSATERALGERTATEDRASERSASANHAQDDVARHRRERVHAAWLKSQSTDKPMTGNELSRELGITPGRARGLIGEWKKEQARLDDRGPADQAGGQA